MVSVMPKALGDANRDDATEKAAKKATEDLTVAEQGRMLRTGCLTVEQVSMNNAFGISAQCRAEGAQHERRQKASADTQLLNLMDQMRDLMDQMEAKYGEDFADNIVEDLHLEGKISDEERDRIMAIEDKEERQQAIMDLLLEKLENGEITKDDLKDMPEVIEYIEMKKEKSALEHDVADDYIAGKITSDNPAFTDSVASIAEAEMISRGIKPENITDKPDDSVKAIAMAGTETSDNDRMFSF